MLSFQWHCSTLRVLALTCESPHHYHHILFFSYLTFATFIFACLLSLFYICRTALSQQCVTLPQAQSQRESSERPLRIEIDTLRAKVQAQSVGLGNSATDAASIAQVMKSLEGGLELLWIHVPLGLSYQALHQSSIFFFIFFSIVSYFSCLFFVFLLAPTPGGDCIKSATRRDRQSEVWRMIIYFLSFSHLFSSYLFSSHLLLSPLLLYPPMFVLWHYIRRFYCSCSGVVER